MEYLQLSMHADTDVQRNTASDGQRHCMCIYGRRKTDAALQRWQLLSCAVFGRPVTDDHRHKRHT
jgi:hypothetical protein